MINSIDKHKNVFYILGKSILFASMQFAIGSVEMSSKFSVKNFSSDQATLDNAVSALKDYIIIGFLWTFGTSLIFYVNYGIKGLALNILSNFVIIAWIYISYQVAFKDAAKRNKLVVKPLFAKTI
jgi:hypothetical protein